MEAKNTPPAGSPKQVEGREADEHFFLASPKHESAVFPLHLLVKLLQGAVDSGAGAYLSLEAIKTLLGGLATATQEREAARQELRQVGWYGPYGIIPGGMDNAPTPGWLPVYLLKPAA